MKFKQTLIAPALVAAAALSSPAQADVFRCRAEIRGVLIYSDSSVNVAHSERGDWTVICNLTNFRSGVSPETCAEWTKLLLQLKAAGRRADFYYNTAAATSCADLPTYAAAPVPHYIGAIENEPPVTSSEKLHAGAPEFDPPLPGSLD
jgi:hypothetical protein